jgi:hypothetical protein
MDVPASKWLNSVLHFAPITLPHIEPTKRHINNQSHSKLIKVMALFAHIMLWLCLASMVFAGKASGRKNAQRAGCASEPPLVVVALSDDCPFGYMESREIISIMVPSRVGGSSCSAQPSTSVSSGKVESGKLRGQSRQRASVQGGTTQPGAQRQTSRRTPPSSVGNGTTSSPTSGQGDPTVSGSVPAAAPAANPSTSAVRQKSTASTVSPLTSLIVMSLIPLTLKFND